MNYPFQAKYEWKEFEDHSWFPGFLRNFQTDFIGFVVRRFNVYGAFIKYINSLKLPALPMYDLCSGSGEPAAQIFENTNCFSHLILSDKFPNIKTFNNSSISYKSAPEDVVEMEFKHGFCYTMFNAFHHFNDRDKLEIAKRISKSGSRAFFVEVLEPSLGCLLKVAMLTTLGNLVLTPFIRPFSFGRLFFTYIIPVNILSIFYDGVVSVFKSRSLKRYGELFAGDKNIYVFKLKKNYVSLLVIEIKPAYEKN